MDILIFILIIIVVGILILFGGKKVTLNLLGAFLIFFGIRTLVKPKYYNPIYGFHFDFTGYNIPFGIIMTVVGVLFIWNFIKKKTDNKK